MTEQWRRAIPRLPADWVGVYKFECSKERWRPCRFIDLSSLGAGLELIEFEPDEDVNGRVTVSFELHGEPRSIVLNEDNRTARVGIEFPNPTEAAEDHVRSLNALRSGW